MSASNGSFAFVSLSFITMDYKLKYNVLFHFTCIAFIYGVFDFLLSIFSII